MHISLIGHVCIDKNVTEQAEYVNWGSSVAYIADYLKKFPTFNYLIFSNWGKDFEKYAVQFNLYPKNSTLIHTLITENNTKKEKRTRKNMYYSESVYPTLDKEALDVLSMSDAIVVATLLPNYTAHDIRDTFLQLKTNKKQLKVLLPQGYFRDVSSDGFVVEREFKEWKDVLPLFDLIIMSDDEHPEADKLAQKWQNETGVNVIVTHGENGAKVFQQRTEKLIPGIYIPPESIVDSVGCGDVFSAAVIIMLLKGSSLYEAVEYAHEEAAKKLTQTPL